MKQIVFFFLSLLVIPHLHAQNYLLKGTIGKSTVVMDIAIAQGVAEVTYFYTSNCADVSLRGGQIAGGVSGYATRRSYVAGRKYDTSERILLKLNPNKTWSGTWTNDKNKKQEVVLTPIDLATVKHAFAELPVVKEFKAREPYEYVRSSMLPIDRDANAVAKGKFKIKYFHLRGTSIKLFFIAEGLDRAVGEKVNNTLMNKFIENACSYCSCAATIGAPNYEYNIDNLYLSENILSAYITFQYFCKGEAHADGAEDPININMKTGEELELEDVLHLSNVAVPEAGSPKWFVYREKVYVPQLILVMQGVHPKQMANKEDCDYNVVKRWVNPEWYINDKGLYISPVFPAEIAPCRNPTWSFIPFDALKKYKDPKKNIALP